MDCFFLDCLFLQCVILSCLGKGLCVPLISDVPQLGCIVLYLCMFNLLTQEWPKSKLKIKNPRDSNDFLHNIVKLLLKSLLLHGLTIVNGGLTHQGGLFAGF